MSYSTEWESRGVVWTYWGVVGGDELRRSNEEIYGDERFDDMTYQIVDLTAVERFDVSAEDMVVVAATDRAAALSNPNVRVAVVARDALVKELSALYETETAASPWRQRVFDTIAEARSWVTSPVTT